MINRVRIGEEYFGLEVANIEMQKSLSEFEKKYIINQDRYSNER